MRAKGNASLIVFDMALLFLMIVQSSCEKTPVEKTTFNSVEQRVTEIDATKVELTTSIPRKILKTEDIGYVPKAKFFWVLLKERADRQKLEEIASGIIEETVAKKGKIYHSFTFHFFDETGFVGSPERSKAFAKINFFPDGSQDKVGRVPIDDYKNYQFVCLSIK
jgi:hypothetical protein